MVVSADRLWSPFRWLMWGGAAFLLLLPLLARAPWTASDFVVMGAMLAIACGTVELALRASGDGAYRLGCIAAVGGGFLLIWVNLAVGFLGDEDNPANLMFLGVLAVAIAGAIVARSDARLMARAMFVTAAAQALVGVIGYAGGFASPGAQGVYEVVMGTTLFVSIWGVSALLFRHSARKQSSNA